MVGIVIIPKTKKRKILKMIMVEVVTSRVADHIWGGCGPPSGYTYSQYSIWKDINNFV